MIDCPSSETSRGLNVLKAHVKMLFSCFGSGKAQATATNTASITTTTSSTARRPSRKATRPRSRTEKKEAAPDCGREERRVRVKRKVVVVGDGECGKTCLLQRFCRDTYQLQGYLPTVIDTEVVDVDLDENTTVELMITDTAGQEDYDRLRPYSYWNTDAVVVCFAIDNPASLENVQHSWVPELRHFCGSEVPVLLVGNKSDLRHHESGAYGGRGDLSTASSGSSDFSDFPECSPSASLIKQGPVKGSSARKLAAEIGAVGYWETSALLDQGVREVFVQAASSVALRGGGGHGPQVAGCRGKRWGGSAKQQRDGQYSKRGTSLLERLGMKKSRQG